MEQKFDTTPKAEIRVEKAKLIRSEVTHDWGLLLRWEIRRDGQVVATPNARLSTTFEQPGAPKGKYEAVLQMWKYVDYRKDAKGEFTNSKFIDISNKVQFTL
ncbi:MAG: hypothetical protein EXR99_03445 [Gemmataceae bacterium]|nr:hypothetical protein [Gemmataceae bacterium]